jgi:mRNA-degrading endonuclease RelE of RelBE toxin-antitoxin system
MWEVKSNRKLDRKISKLPENVRLLQQALVQDLKTKGFNPGKKWQNFSPLGKDRYHCHLNYRYVACWEVLNHQIRLMEVYYVGSREKAPY